jgi:hypothetical protein
MENDRKIKKSTRPITWVSPPNDRQT